jgi:sigma-B regulation protein RsbU (phosphoserine phosphatase)
MDELQAGAKELSRIQGRIQAGREVQEILLPSPIPQPDWGQVAAVNYPADKMSGDIYDVFLDAAGRLVVSVADVSGKGVPAAFVTAIIQDALRQAASHLEDLGDIIRRVNAAMTSYSATGCFATMVVCRWSSDGHTVEIANAGHHAPLWVDSAGRAEPFPERVGLILGFDANWLGEVVTRDASSDEAMLLSSDGATEARNPDGQDLELSGLGECFARRHDQDAQTIVTGLLDDVKRYSAPSEPRDDVTFLVVKREGRA